MDDVRRSYAGDAWGFLAVASGSVFLTLLIEWILIDAVSPAPRTSSSDGLIQMVQSGSASVLIRFVLLPILSIVVAALIRAFVRSKGFRRPTRDDIAIGIDVTFATVVAWIFFRLDWGVEYRNLTNLVENQHQVCHSSDVVAATEYVCGRMRQLERLTNTGFSPLGVMVALLLSSMAWVRTKGWKREGATVRLQWHAMVAPFVAATVSLVLLIVSLGQST